MEISIEYLVFYVRYIQLQGYGEITGDFTFPNGVAIPNIDLIRAWWNHEMPEHVWSTAHNYNHGDT